MDPDSDNDCSGNPFEYDSNSDLDERKLADFVRPAPTVAADTKAVTAPAPEPPKPEPAKPKRTYSRKPKEDVPQEKPVPPKAKKQPPVKAVKEVKGKGGAKPHQPPGAVKRREKREEAPAPKKRKAPEPPPPLPPKETVPDMGDLRERVRAELMGDFIRYTLKAASDFKTDVVNSLSGRRDPQQS
jgi:hypothetical protein